MNYKSLSEWLLVAFAFAAFVLQPLPAQAQFQWSEFAPIIAIQVTPAGVAYVRLDPNIVTNKHDCPNFNGWFIAVDFFLDRTQLGYREMIASWYAAAAMGNPVRIGGFGCFQNTFPQASYLYMQN